MSVQTEIKNYIAGLPETKQKDVLELHKLTLKLLPKCKLWFLDGKNEAGKFVTNPNIGYGTQIMNLAGGKTREFYKVGFSANTSGISVYIIGFEDKTYLAKTYGKKIGKAKVTGYCIAFKSLKDIDLKVLSEAIKDGFNADKPKK
jgi:hypothetical protein